MGPNTVGFNTLISGHVGDVWPKALAGFSHFGGFLGSAGLGGYEVPKSPVRTSKFLWPFNLGICLAPWALNLVSPIISGLKPDSLLVENLEPASPRHSNPKSSNPAPYHPTVQPKEP